MSTPEVNPLISIIVPIYNVENYLNKCIDSILAQTYRNIEIILSVSFGTDSCERICDEYALKDARVKVIKSEPRGLSEGRNKGIDIATGDYLGFVDADDYIAPTMYEGLLQLAVGEDADVSVCGYALTFETSTKLAYPPLGNKRIMTNVEAIESLFIAAPYGGVMAWNKLYKRKIFMDTNIKYPIGCLHEDNLTTYKLYFHANKVAFTNEVYYYYLQRTSSLMNQGFSIKEMTAVRAADEAFDFVTNNQLDLDGQASCNIVLANFTLLNNALFCDNTDKDAIKVLKDNICKHESFAKPYLAKHYRIWLVFFHRGDNYYRLFIRCYNLLKRRLMGRG